MNVSFKSTGTDVGYMVAGDDPLRIVIGQDDVKAWEVCEEKSATRLNRQAAETYLSWMPTLASTHKDSTLQKDTSVRDVPPPAHTEDEQETIDGLPVSS